MSLRQTVLVKAEKVKEIKSLLQQYKTLGVASLQKVRATQLQQLKKKLSEDAHLRVVKNSVIKRAIVDSKNIPGLENLEEHIGGPNILLFTNLNPFKLVLLLEKNRVKASARAGDIAAIEVIIPAGNTGLPPGPIISQFTAIGVTTRIEGGSVYVARNTTVAKKGEIIAASMTSILSKLGIKPVEVGLTMKAAYDHGIVLVEDQLRIDLSAIQRTVQKAHANAFNLSLKAAYPLPENITLLLQTVHHEAYGLALNVGVPTPDTIKDLIRKAHTEMLSLNMRLATNNRKIEPANAIQKG